jgi:protein phosphatase
MDVSHRVLDIAEDRLNLERLPLKQRDRVKLIHGSLTYRDKRIANFDAAALVEAIEHLDAPRLSSLERVVFEAAKPKTVVVTTPNVEYNVKFETLPAGTMRHKDHRFEWTRTEFEHWAEGIASRFGYTVRTMPVGPTDPEVGAPTQISGSGKSTFARKHFLATEVVSSDACRGIVADDENDQAATSDAFDVLHYIASMRLSRGRLVAVDATNVQPEARKGLIDLARRHHVLLSAIVFNVPEELCLARNRQRPERSFGPHVIRRQARDLRRSLGLLKREGFRYVYVLRTPEEIDDVTIERQPLWTNKKSERGPFEIIGDVHGCASELECLLGELGYVVGAHVDGVWSGPVFGHPEGRKAIFVGDLVYRGPRVIETIKLVRNMVTAGNAFCVPGNHDVKLVRALRGRDVQITHGLAESLAEFRALPEEARAEFTAAASEFLDSLVSHFVLDDGKLVVAHAGLVEALQGRSSAKVRDFAMYGETTGKTDEFGLPFRFN